MSADGRYVAFQSTFSDLVAGDTNASTDIFIRDRQSPGALQRVAGNAHSLLPAISDDGQFVAFSSFSSNLVGDDTNGAYDAFLWSRANNSVVRVSKSSDDAQGGAPAADNWTTGDISANGRYVVYDTRLNNLHPGDTTGNADVFLTDMAIARTKTIIPLPASQSLGTCDNFLGGTDATGNCAADDEVQGASGSYTDSVTDLSLPSPGIPFALTRTYNSADSGGGVLGSGWKVSFGARLEFVAGSSDVQVVAEDGQRATYLWNPATSAFVSSPGVTSTLSKAGAPVVYTLKTLDGSTQTFNASGQLTATKDEHGLGLTYGYTGSQVTSITDSAGRTATLTYLGNGLLQRVTLPSPDSRYVEYGYSSIFGVDVLASVRDTRGYTTNYAYYTNPADPNSFRRLWKQTDPRGNAAATPYPIVTVVYGAGGRVLSRTDGEGKTTSYSWDQATQTATRTDPNLKAWKQTYSGNVLMSETDPLNKTTTYGYDAKMNRVLVRDARGNETRFAFDANGNQTEMMPPAPFTFPESDRYDITNSNGALINKRVSHTDRRGYTTAYAYFSNGDLQMVTDPLSGTTTYTYETPTSRGLVKTETDERNKTTTYSYDAAGNRTSIKTPMNFETKYEYDGAGRMTAEIDPRGQAAGANPLNFKTTYTYDAADQQLTVTDPLNHTTTYVYDQNGNRTTVTDARGKVTTTVYDKNNRPTSVTEPRTTTPTVTTATTTTEYDNAGNVVAVVGPNGQRTEFVYDDASRRTKVITPRGNVSGGIKADYTWTTVYDENGNALSVTNPLGHVTTSVFDELNRVVSVTNQIGKKTTTTYDAEDHVLSVTDPLGNTTRNVYDALGRVTSTTTPRGKTATRAYDAAGNLLEEVSPLGNKTTYTYNDDGRMDTRIEPRGYAAGAVANDFKWTYTYDEAGNQTVVTDPLGKQTNTTFDAAGNTTAEVDALGHATLFTYDQLDQLKSVTGPDSTATCTAGPTECVQVTLPNGTTALRKSTMYEYDDSGNVVKRTDPNGHVRLSTYDLSERLIDTQAANGKHWSFGYDVEGNQTTQITARGNAGTPATGTITKAYDARGLVTSITYGDGTTPNVSFTYDAASRRLTMVDGAGTESYGYDDANRLNQVTRGAESFAYGYDPDSGVTSRTYPDGTVHSATFDDDGRLASVTSAGNTTNFGYDEAGNLKTTTLPASNGHTITRSYDRVGRPVGAQSTKGATTLVNVSQTLDDVGNPIAQTVTRAIPTPAGLVAAYNFDEGSGTTLNDRSGGSNNGSLVGGVAWTASGKNGGALQFDGVDDRVSIPDVNALDLTTKMTVEAWVYPTAGSAQKTIIEKEAAGSLSYGIIHDGSRRPQGRIRNAGGTQSANGGTALALNTWSHVAVTYDSTVGTPTVTLYVNGAQVATKTTTGAITASTGVLSIGGNTVRAAEWFTGRIDDVRIYNRALSAAEISTDSTTPVASSTSTTINEAFQYDDADRLTKDCYQTTTCTGATSTITWTYDLVGNRLTQNRVGMPSNNTNATYNYNVADQLTSAVVAGGATTTYTYDDDGNQITDGAKTMVYDLENRLKSHASGATTTTYTYDGTDKRLTRATNGTIDRKFSWDTVGGLPELALERDGTGALVRRYVQGPIGPVSMATSAGVYWYHTDPLGSVRAVTDSAGIEQWRYDFDPYGEARAITQTQAGAPVNPVQFTGEYVDAESGLYHLRARQYDPNTGRFDALDPVDGPMTDPYTGEYVYVGDSPLLRVDPSGECFFGICHAASWAANKAGSAIKAHASFNVGTVKGAWSGVKSTYSAVRHPVTTVKATYSLASYASRHPVAAAKRVGSGAKQYGRSFASGSWTARGEMVGKLGVGVVGAKGLGTGGRFIKGNGPGARAPSLFGRSRTHGASGVLNRGPVRLGYGWKGNSTTGGTVFRLAIGTPSRPTHFHVDLAPKGRRGWGGSILGKTVNSRSFRW